MESNFSDNLLSLKECNCKDIHMPFKHAIPLPSNPFYIDKSYVGLRKTKLIAISDRFGQIKQFHNFSYEKQIEIIKYIENSCLNETIRKSREYNIRCVWNNIQFENIYHSICYNILTALDIRSETGSKILIN
jgi:hypothetical protein